MVEVERTVLTDRQVQVLERREQGATQQEIADELGTTASNVSAIERAGRDNAEKARRTIELLRTIRAPEQFTVQSGTEFDELIDQVYAHGDEAGIKIDYRRPELYGHLYDLLEDVAEGNRITTGARVGVTTDGDVEVFTE